MNLFDSPSHSKNTDGRKEKITNKGSISISRENNGGQKGENKEKAVIVAGDREVESVAESLGEVMISNTYEEGTIGTRRRVKRKKPQNGRYNGRVNQRLTNKLEVWKKK